MFDHRLLDCNPLPRDLDEAGSIISGIIETRITQQDFIQNTCRIKGPFPKQDGVPPEHGVREDPFHLDQVDQLVLTHRRDIRDTNGHEPLVDLRDAELERQADTFRVQGILAFERRRTQLGRVSQVPLSVEPQVQLGSTKANEVANAKGIDPRNIVYRTGGGGVVTSGMWYPFIRIIGGVNPPIIMLLIFPCVSGQLDKFDRLKHYWVFPSLYPMWGRRSRTPLRASRQDARCPGGSATRRL